MPGLMIDEAADDEVRESCAACHHLGQRQIDGRRLADRFAGPTGDARANMTQDTEAGGHVIQHFTDVSEL